MHISIINFLVDRLGRLRFFCKKIYLSSIIVINFDGQVFHLESPEVAAPTPTVDTLYRAYANKQLFIYTI